MCMEDIRLGRETITRITNVTMGTADAILIGNEPRRKSLIICQPSNGSVQLLPRSTASGTVGFDLAPGMAPIILTVEHHGSLVTDEWHGLADAGAPIVTFIESLLIHGTEKQLNVVPTSS